MKEEVVHKAHSAVQKRFVTEQSSLAVTGILFSTHQGRIKAVDLGVGLEIGSDAGQWFAHPPSNSLQYYFLFSVDSSYPTAPSSELVLEGQQE